jgi:hypothetical protein
MGARQGARGEISMPAPSVYRIHPAIGIARLGDSPDSFCISPEGPARLPIECDGAGNPVHKDESTSKSFKFKDAEGRIKRQAARFQIYVYDAENPEGKPLRIGDPIEGGGNQGTLVDIQWRVQLANKKSAWFTFDGLRGEIGYPPGTALRPDDHGSPGPAEAHHGSGATSGRLRVAPQGELQPRRQPDVCGQFPADRHGAARHRHFGGSAH